MGEPRYKYNTLPQASDHVRLLKFERFSQADVDQRLSISLITFPLDCVPAYHALSYCWGSQRTYRSIYCKKQVIRITPSLFSALLALRGHLSKRTDQEDQWLWVDQLCINQADIQERSYQVSLMNGIFSQAVRTIIWLGADNGFAEDGFKLAYAVYNVAQREYPEHATMETLPWRNFGYDIHHKRGLPGMERSEWECLRMLLRAPWFERLWVVQEAVLSAQDPIVLCGRYECSWYVFATAASWLWNNDYFEVNFQQFLPRSTSNAESIRQIRATSEPWDVGGLLYMTNGYFQTTNASDKIYGLMGLVSRRSKDLPSVRYDKPPNQAYRDLTRYMVMQKGMLAALDHPSCYSNRLWDPYRCFGRQFWWRDTPTWTPNLDTYICPEQFSCLDRDHGVCSVGWYPFYQASAGMEMRQPEGNRLQADADPNILHLNGLRMDIVDHCFEINTPRGLHLQFLRLQDWPLLSMLRSSWRYIRTHGHLGYVRTTLHHLYSYINGFRRPVILRLWTKMMRRHMNKDIVASARALAMVGTIGMNPEQKEFSQEEDWPHFCAYMVETYDKWKTSFTTEPTLFHSSFDILREHANRGTASKYDTAMKYACVIRRFFLTENGRVGVGPTGTRKGDVVTVLFGSGVPCILRRYSERQWMFVGFCYIHGLMEGQSITMWKDDVIKEQSFEII